VAARLSVFVVAIACACASPIRSLAPTDHAGAAGVVVPTPPPLARVEVVPDPPASLTEPCWIDGAWDYRGRDWRWNPGRWIACDPSLGYAPPRLERRPTGALVFFAGAVRALAPSPAPTASLTPEPAST
jgi:hypothetical protein